MNRQEHFKGLKSAISKSIRQRGKIPMKQEPGEAADAETGEKAAEQQVEKAKGFK